MTDHVRHAPSPLAAGKIATEARKPAPQTTPKMVEIGGPKGPEPTRYGDWERAGKCVDF